MTNPLAKTETGPAALMLALLQDRRLCPLLLAQALGALNYNLLRAAIAVSLVFGTGVEASGGVRGFVHYLETRHWVHNGFRAQMLAWMTGLIIFVESSITLLVAGSVSRPLFDRYQVSREKLAYIVDSTAAPIAMLIPINAWGAYVIGLLRP